MKNEDYQHTKLLMIEIKDILLDDPDIGLYIAEENLEYLEQPELYCGLDAEIVDEIP